MTDAKMTQPTKKQCLACGNWKRVTEFTAHRKYPDGRRNTCRTCDAQRQRDRRAARPPEPDRRRQRLPRTDWLEVAQSELFPGRRCMELESDEWLAVVARARQLRAEAA